MAGIGAMINSALGGLNVATTALQTTGHNIGNVNTPGYSRQSVQQSARLPQYTGAGFIGTGVQADGIVRSYDSYLQNQIWQGTANSSALSTLNGQLSQLNNLLSDPKAGLSPALNDFFTAAQSVANNPSGIPERQALISNAQVLAARFQTLDGRMNQMEQEVNTQLQERLASVNTLSQQIATVNQRIFELQGDASGQVPNDLLDQRDQLIARLNEEIGISVVRQTDGRLNLFTGNGQVLVAGSKAYELAAVPNAYDPTRLEIGYRSTGAVISNGISGGALGGLLRFRSESLDVARNALGRIAEGVAVHTNAQQRLGLDLNGALGGPLFSEPTPLVHANRNNGSPGASLSALVSDVSQLSASDYQVEYSGGVWQVTRSSDGQTVLTSGGGPLSFDGLTVTVSGTANNGDKFLIQPTHGAASAISVLSADPAKIAAAAPYVSNPGNNTGLVSISTGAVVAASGDVNVPASAFGQDLTVTFTSSSTFQISSGSPAAVIASGAYVPGGTSISVAYPAGAGNAYWQVQLSGAPAVSGDSFSLTRAGVDENHNALALANLQTRNTLLGGSTTFGGAYGQLVTQIGTDGQQAQVGDKALANQLQQVKQAQQAVAGVNLDEEAANLVRFQQAYQASAKVIQVADTLFQSILAIKGA
ncbi:MAG: flagellar hook-associated protein FlgK [Pseudomonadota bacterium]